jgi:hypothetical protein
MIASFYEKLPCAKWSWIENILEENSNGVIFMDTHAVDWNQIEYNR